MIHAEVMRIGWRWYAYILNDYGWVVSAGRGLTLRGANRALDRQLRWCDDVAGARRAANPTPEGERSE